MQSDNSDKITGTSGEETTLTKSEETQPVLNDGLHGLNLMSDEGEHETDNDAENDGIWLPHPNWLRPVDEEDDEDYGEQSEEQ